MLNVQNEDAIMRSLADFVRCDPTNSLASHNHMKIYDEPVVGVAAADDTYFSYYREKGVAGPNFILPGEWLLGARSVISYFLPFSKEVRDSNRKSGMPSQEWVSARIDGEDFNNLTRTFLVKLLKTMGADAMTPGFDPRFRVENIESNWSERHVAFIAGLGTFGLHRALITSKGSAGRIGSIITTLELKPTPRNYDSYYQYCPYLTEGKCGVCMKRCPPSAIDKDGKDNKACGGYIDNEIRPIYAPRYGCAKCNIDVPCEYKIPVV